MPRDKTENTKKILEVAKEEFLEKEFTGSSMRNMGKEVGMA